MEEKVNLSSYNILLGQICSGEKDVAQPDIQAALAKGNESFDRVVYQTVDSSRLILHPLIPIGSFPFQYQGNLFFREGMSFSTQKKYSPDQIGQLKQKVLSRLTAASFSISPDQLSIGCVNSISFNGREEYFSCSKSIPPGARRENFWIYNFYYSIRECIKKDKPAQINFNFSDESLYLTQVGSKIIFVPKRVVPIITDHNPPEKMVDGKKVLLSLEEYEKRVLEQVKEPIRRANPHQVVTDEELRAMMRYSDDGQRFIPYSIHDESRSGNYW